MPLNRKQTKNNNKHKSGLKKKDNKTKDGL